MSIIRYKLCLNVSNQNEMRTFYIDFICSNNSYINDSPYSHFYSFKYFCESLLIIKIYQFLNSNKECNIKM